MTTLIQANWKKIQREMTSDFDGSESEEWVDCCFCYPRQH